MNADKRPSAPASSPPPGMSAGGGLPGSKRSGTHNVRPAGKVGVRNSVLHVSKTGVADSASKTGSSTTGKKGFSGSASSANKIVEEPSAEDNGPPDFGAKPSKATAFDVDVGPLAEAPDDAVPSPGTIPRQCSSACVKTPGSRLPIPNLVGRRNSEERGDTRKSPAPSQTSLRSNRSAKSNKSNVSVSGREFPSPVQSPLLSGILESIAEDSELVDKITDKSSVANVVEDKGSKAKRSPSSNVQSKMSSQSFKGRQLVTSVKSVASNNSSMLVNQIPNKLKSSPSAQHKPATQRGVSHGSVAATSQTPLPPLTNISPESSAQESPKTAVSPVAFVQPVANDLNLNKPMLNNSKPKDKAPGSPRNNAQKQKQSTPDGKPTVAGVIPKGKVTPKLMSKLAQSGKIKITPPSIVTVAKVEITKKDIPKTEASLGIAMPPFKAKHNLKNLLTGAKKSLKKNLSKGPKVAALQQEPLTQIANASSLPEDALTPAIPQSEENFPNSNTVNLESLLHELSILPKSDLLLQEEMPLQLDSLLSEAVNDSKPIYCESDSQTEKLIEVPVESSEMPSQTEETPHITMDTQTPICTFSEVENQTDHMCILDSETQTPILSLTVSEVQTYFMQCNSNSETQTALVANTEAESQTCVAVMLPVDIQATETMAEAETQMQHLEVSEHQSQTSQLHLATIESQTSRLQIATVESQTTQLNFASMETQTAVLPQILKIDSQTSMEMDVVNPSMSFLAIFFVSVVYRLWLRMQVQALTYSPRRLALELIDVEMDVSDAPSAVSSSPFVPGVDLDDDDTVISGGAAHLLYCPSTIVFEESGSYSLEESCSSELLQTVAENLENLSCAMAEWSSEGLLSQESKLELPHPSLPDSDELTQWWHPKVPTRFDYSFNTKTDYTFSEIEHNNDLFEDVTSPVTKVGGQASVLELPEAEEDAEFRSVGTSVMSNCSMTILDAHDLDTNITCVKQGEEVASKTLSLEIPNMDSPASFYCQDAVCYMAASHKPDAELGKDHKMGFLLGERSDEIMVTASLNIDLSFLDCVEEAAAKAVRSVESVRSDSILFTDADEYLDGAGKIMGNEEKPIEVAEKDVKNRVEDECGDSDAR